MLVSLIVIVATIAPWTIRNAQVFGHFVPMSTSDGVNLSMGDDRESDGFYSPLPVTVQGLNEFEQNRILSEDALLFVSEHPLMFVARTFKKAALLHISERRLLLGIWRVSSYFPARTHSFRSNW